MIKINEAGQYICPACDDDEMAGVILSLEDRPDLIGEECEACGEEVSA